MTGGTAEAAVARGLLLVAQFTAEDAAAVVRRRLRGVRVHEVEPTHHEYAGFVHRVAFGRSRATRADQLVHTLVDRVAGSALIAPPFPQATTAGDRPAGPITGRPAGETGTAQQERIARRVVETAMMRRSRLGRSFEVALVDTVDAVWKPNWLVRGEHRGRRIRVLVDALNGQHWTG